MLGTTDIPLPILAWIGLKVIRQEKNLETWLEIYYKEKGKISSEKTSKNSGPKTQASNTLHRTELRQTLDQALNLPFDPLTSLNTAHEPFTYPCTPPPTPDLVDTFLHPHRTVSQQDGPGYCHNSSLSLDSHLLHQTMSLKGLDTFGKAFRPET